MQRIGRVDILEEVFLALRKVGEHTATKRCRGGNRKARNRQMCKTPNQESPEISRSPSVLIVSELYNWLLFRALEARNPTAATFLPSLDL